MKPDKKAEKRQRILDAASILFVKNGYDATKMADIAKESGVAKGTVYEYYDSKEQLMFEWAHRVISSSQERMKETIRDDLTVREQIQHYIEAKAEIMQQFQTIFRIILSSTGFSRSSDTAKNAHDKLVESYESEVGLLVKMIEDGKTRGEIRADLDAHLAVTSIMGVILSTMFTKTAAAMPDKMELPANCMVHELPPKPAFVDAFVASSKTWEPEHVADIIFAGICSRK